MYEKSLKAEHVSNAIQKGKRSGSETVTRKHRKSEKINCQN